MRGWAGAACTGGSPILGQEEAAPPLGCWIGHMKWVPLDVPLVLPTLPCPVAGMAQRRHCRVKSGCCGALGLHVPRMHSAIIPYTL